MSLCFRCLMPLQLEAPDFTLTPRGTHLWEMNVDKLCWIQAAKPPSGRTKPSLSAFLEAFWACRGREAELAAGDSPVQGRFEAPDGSQTSVVKPGQRSGNPRAPLLECFSSDRIMATSLDP